jgi:Domain of unknown function (DUF4394)
MGTRKARRGLLVVLALSVAVPAMAPGIANAGQDDRAAKGKVKNLAKPGGRLFYATDDQGNLLTFRERGSARLLSKRPIEGLPSGVTLVGIDFRPKTGELLGIGSDSTVYRLLVGGVNPRALKVGTGFSPGLTDDFHGVDFNPVPDAIRIVGDGGTNYRVSPITGAHGMGSPDAALNPDNPTIVGAAYSNSSFSDVQPAAGTTTLFTIDSSDDTLNTQGGPGGTPSPNDGTQFPVGPLGVDVSTTVGFDVTGSFATPTGWLTNVRNGKTTLYRVDLASGQASKLGVVGSVGKVNERKGTYKKAATTVTGLAAVQD